MRRKTSNNHLLSPHQNSSLSITELESFAEEWLLDSQIRQHSERTLGNRRMILDHFIQWLKEKQYESCGSKEVRGFLASYTPKGVKAVTVSTYYSRLRTFFNFLVREGVLDVSPMETLQPPTCRADQIQPFTPQQVEALLSATRHSKKPKRDLTLLLCLLDTGMRASEICSLKFSDLDMKSRKCIVRGKGNKIRTLFFGIRLTKALHSYLRSENLQQEDYLFRSERARDDKGMLTPSGLFQMVERLGKVAKIEATRCSPHIFRHTFAVEFLRNGGNIFTLKELLGHTSLAMTNRYVALAQADIENQHRQFSPADRLSAKQRA